MTATPRLWDTFMYAGEADMLEMRLNELDGRVYRHVLVEAPLTHRGDPKPLYYQENPRRWAKWEHRILPVVARNLPSGAVAHWAREHAQRNAAWPVIGAQARYDDVVLIADLDEFPSATALAWRGPGDVVSLRMRTALFAVDREVPLHLLPPTAVMAKAGWLRRHGGNLAGARDSRGSYPVLEDAGWHLSWIGGPEAQRRKLLSSTCHTELLHTPEGELIASGQRWRTTEDGGGLPVTDVEVDESWPAWIRERRCPPEWFRPREQEEAAG